MKTNSFIMLRKELFTDIYSEMSLEEKVALSFIADRFNLSDIKGFHDGEGKICVIFTTLELGRILGCSRQKAGRILAKLEEKRFIHRKLINKGSSYYIYKTEKLNMLKNVTSLCDEADHVAVKKKNSIKNKKTETSKTESSEDRASIRSEIIDMLNNKWNYRYIASLNEEYEAMVGIIVDVAADVFCSRSKVIKVAGDFKDVIYVRSTIARLTDQHILFLIERVMEQRFEITELKQYILTALFNAGISMMA